MKKLLCVLVTLLVYPALNAQTAEELKTQIAAKKDSVAALQSRITTLQNQLNALPGWKVGAFGTLGGSVSEFNNWFAQDIPNNASGTLGFTVNAFANLQKEKFFWRNAVYLNLKWVKLDDKDDPDDDGGFRESTDVFTLSSLYGRKLSKQFAVSTLMEYRSTILSSFNNPGYLDVGVGGTWTPVPDLVVVFHPVNYNFVFSDEDTIFNSSLGAKLVADYTKKIRALSIKSNFSLFQSYRSNDLSNWTWTNAFAYTLWKSFGVGFDFGLRSNKQETLNFIVNNAPNPDPGANFNTIDNELQTYWTVGISYSF